MEAREVFVFAGAGISRSAPSGLPMFDPIRDEILRQLAANSLVDSDSGWSEVAERLVPEPFMKTLRDSKVEVERWLEAVLDGEPNAVHQTLARLAEDGAAVWTVNFDRLIEKSADHLDVLAWPAPPTGAGQLVKPHGSLGGQLILASDDVLSGLRDDWLERLKQDVRGRVVVLVGYSGRDLDFQPIWDDVLTSAREVVWFDQHDRRDPSRISDEAYRRSVMRGVDATGRLRLVPSTPPPSDAPLGAWTNSGADFVAWCSKAGLVDLDRDEVLGLFKSVKQAAFPTLRGDLRLAWASVLGALGNHDAAQQQRLAVLRAAARPGVVRAVRGLAASAMMQGTATGNALLRGAEALPPVRGGAVIRERARRARLTALHRQGQHRRVLGATIGLDEDAVSTLLILRAAAMRMTGSLDEAARLAEEALSRARHEGPFIEGTDGERKAHPLRVAHAAYQRAQALVWAERTDEAWRCLQDELEPLGKLAASRWFAWACFIKGTLAIRDGDVKTAREALGLSRKLFEAEALMDGVVSVRVALLTCRRLAHEDTKFVAEMDQALVDGADRQPTRTWQWYARNSPITIAALDLERAEFARYHQHDQTAAHGHYEHVACAPYPVYACVAQLGLALCAADDDEARMEHAVEAKTRADRIGARLISRRAEEAIEKRSGWDRELFFC